MPGIGGMETLRRLRDAGNDVPVVIVTAHGSIPDAVQAMKLGAIDFLSKPLTPEASARWSPRCSGGTPIGPRRSPPGARPPGASGRRRGRGSRRGPDPGQAGAQPPPVRRGRILLEEALELAPDSAEAQTLMGVLRESLGQDHAAYHAYGRPERRPALRPRPR